MPRRASGRAASAARATRSATPEPAAASGAPDPAGRPGPLVVNLPAAKADNTTGPAPEPPDLRLPHERDQSAVDTAAATPDPVIVQAAKDLAAGQVDTDLHNQPGLDAHQRDRLLRRGH